MVLFGSAAELHDAEKHDYITFRQARRFARYAGAKKRHPHRVMDAELDDIGVLIMAEI